MSAIDNTPPSSQQHRNRHHRFDHRRSSKRKLDDYDFTVGDDDDESIATVGTISRIRRNSTTSSNSKGKSVVDHDHDEKELTVRNLLRGESSGGDCSRLQLQFFVKMITDGKTLVLQANLSDTVEMVQKKIELITRIPVHAQRLIYRGKQLQLEDTLEKCAVQNDAGLQLVGRMRSTDHPQACRVINDMVSLICMICKKEILNSSCRVVKEKLDQFLALITDKNNIYFDSKNHEKKERDKFKRKDWVNDDEKFSKIDYCKIFMDASAPQALVMFYMSGGANKAYADECIRCFVSFVKDLEGWPIGKAYCATIVLEFCRLLKMSVAEDNLLYMHCRSTLGSILEKIELASGRKYMYSSVICENLKAIAIQDVFPFLKELANRLVKELARSVDSISAMGPVPREVCDFSAFLQPVLVFIRRRLKEAATLPTAKGRKSRLGEEVDHLFHLFNELLHWMDICLGNMQQYLQKKKKKEDGFWTSRSQYLSILKELNSISILYPGSEDRFWTMVKQYKDALCGLVVRYANRTEDHSWLHKHKDVLDFESRRRLGMFMFPEVREDYEELHEMLIDRSQLLSESFEYISRALPSSLHAGLFMEFKNEEATGPGVLREWFCLVCQAIFDPQNALFVACPLDRRRFFPNPASKVEPLHLQYFRFSGRVIALALMHKIQVGVVLDRVFFMQLAGKHISMEDIQVADPCMYNSCKQILEMDAEFVDSDGLGLTFVTEVEELGSRKVVELCEGGKDIAVNSKNRKEYVNLIVRHHFVTSITEQVSSFTQGFADLLCDRSLGQTFFQSLELEDLDWMLRGSGSEISVEDWKAHTEYHGYKKSDRQIVWFWEVLSDLNAEQKKTLLSFWTSVKYLPVEGFRGLASRLFIYKSLESHDCLPSSHTCFYRLCIPSYPSKAVMQDRIRFIAQEHVGCSFGTW